MHEYVETVIVGAGQAGLAMSWHLTQAGREHLLLERSPELGSVWRTERWDSFTLVTPNHSLRLPGFGYSGNDPGGFLPREDIVDYVRKYADSFNPPVRFSTAVTSLSLEESGQGFRVETSRGEFTTRKAIVATGTFHRPALPAYAPEISSDVTQLHSSQFRNAASLPPGGVLVVGSGQSGVQITEDLMRAGRQVWLSMGRAKRIQRRYRGRDMYDWLESIGFFAQTFAAAPEPKSRLEASPQLTGFGRDRTINPHRFAQEGVHLLGRIIGSSDGVLSVNPDLHENLRSADQFSARVNANVDRFIEKTGIDAPYDPEDREPSLTDGFFLPERTSVDLRREGITSIIWSAGYRPDWSWLHLSAINENGYPIQERGISDVPNLFFLGQHWMHNRASGLFAGVGADAEYLCDAIVS